jgi:hypothetical protein
MCGFLIGTACLLGLIYVLRRSRCGGRRGRFGGHDGSRWGEGFFLKTLLQRLDATSSQERVIRDAISEMRAAGESARDELRKSRGDVARAMRGESFDEVLFGELFARHDTAIESLRRAGLGAIAKVHNVLDTRQRERLADLIEQGPRSWGR